MVVVGDLRIDRSGTWGLLGLVNAPMSTFIVILISLPVAFLLFLAIAGCASSFWLEPAVAHDE